MSHVLKNKLAKHVIIAGKEYYKCSYDILIDELASCIKFFENIDIDKTPDIFKEENKDLAREKIFDTSKYVNVVFLNDDFVDEYYSSEESDNSYDSDISDSLTESSKVLIGGALENLIDKSKYLKYKIKYLVLLDELQ